LRSGQDATIDKAYSIHLGEKCFTFRCLLRLKPQ
jgi:hypothetical protein